MTGTDTLQTARFRGANGHELSGDLIGPETGNFVVLTHGGGQTRHSWGTTARTLAKEGYRVLSLDLRGHGDSDWSPEQHYSIGHHGEDIAAIIKSSAPGPATLVGASLGGLASLLVTGVLLPERVSALVLVDVAINVRPDGAKRITDFMHRHVNGFKTLEEAAEAISAYRPDQPRRKDMSGLRKNLRIRNGHYFWHWDPAMLKRPSADGAPIMPKEELQEAAKNVVVPTLLVRGLRSDVIDEGSEEALREFIPHLETTSVQNAGHMVVGDNNAVFEERIIDFLKRVQAR